MSFKNPRWAREGRSEPCYGDHKISDELLSNVRWLLDHFDDAAPRVISSARSRKPVLVYSDGACEDTGVTIARGAKSILLGPADMTLRTLGVRVASCRTGLWFKDCAPQYIP